VGGSEKAEGFGARGETSPLLYDKLIIIKFEKYIAKDFSRILKEDPK
jgi:hypothetical protein